MILAMDVSSDVQAKTPLKLEPVYSEKDAGEALDEFLLANGGENGDVKGILNGEVDTNGKTVEKQPIVKAESTGNDGAAEESESVSIPKNSETDVEVSVSLANCIDAIIDKALGQEKESEAMEVEDDLKKEIVEEASKMDVADEAPSNGELEVKIEDNDIDIEEKEIEALQLQINTVKTLDENGDDEILDENALLGDDEPVDEVPAEPSAAKPADDTPEQDSTSEALETIEDDVAAETAVAESGSTEEASSMVVDESQTTAEGESQVAMVVEESSEVEPEPSAIAAEPSAVAAKPSAVEAEPSAVEAKPSAVGAESSVVEAESSAVEAEPSAVAAKTSAVAAKTSAVAAESSALKPCPISVKPLSDLLSTSTTAELDESLKRGSEEPAEQEIQVEKKKRRVEVPDTTTACLTLSEDEDADDPAPMTIDEDADVDAEADGQTEGEAEGEGEKSSSNRAADSEEEAKASSASGCSSPGPSTSQDGQVSAEQRALIAGMRSLRKGVLSTLTRFELEELMVQKLCETITDRSQVGELRRRVETLEDEVTKWKERAAVCQKQARELELVLQKYLVETQRQKLDGGKIVSPVRVTRSVGLQVAVNNFRRVLPPNRPVQKGNRSPIKSSPARPGTFTQASPNRPPVNRQSPANRTLVPTSPTKIVKKPMKTASSNTGVIDLTDDEKPSGPSTPYKTVTSLRPVDKSKLLPTQKVAYLVNAAQKGNSPHYILAPPPPQLMYKGVQPQPVKQIQSSHPAPLPPQPPVKTHPTWKKAPPRPSVKISNTAAGIVLSWDMVINDAFAPIASYQLYAYQENNQVPTAMLWKEVGDVKAMTLPMACTLTSFIPGHRYHFSVRAVDVHMRIGPFSLPGSISLNKA